MIIYAKYNEDDNYFDVIYVPNSPEIDFEHRQKMFFEWLFDKNNNHEYWRNIDGEKTYCEYDVEAFVKWLNTDAYCSVSDKAKVLMKNVFQDIGDSEVLIF